jgi:pimeloyl-ACP methyl ester carboxylesterase
LLVVNNFLVAHQFFTPSTVTFWNSSYLNEKTKMKNKLILIILAFIALCINVFAQTSAYPFEVNKSGKGKSSIIFIPGFSCSAKVWDDTKKVYESNYTCYSLTMAGFAGVQPQAEPTFKNWEKGIAGFIKENKIDKPFIVGHSMGGGLALALAADYPDLIGGIVVVDALPCLSAMMDPGFKSQENPDCSAMEGQIKKMPDEQFYRMQKMNITQLLQDTAKQELVVSWSVRSDRETFSKMYCHFSNTDLRKNLSTISCPNLVLLEAPFAGFKQVIEEQYAALKNANLQYAGKGLHFIMYDDKEWYLTQLSKFIKP